MKNTLTIDMTNSYAVDMLSNVDAGVGVNRVYIEVKCDLTKTNTISFAGTTYTATSDDYIVEIPQAQWVGTGNLIVTLSDGTTTKSLTVHKLKAIDASVFLKRITDAEYTFKTSRNPTEASVGTLQEEVDSLKIRMGAAENVNAEQTRDIATNAGNISTNATNITALQNGKVNNSEKGAANGVATLNGDGKVPESQLPSYVDDVLEYASRSAFPGTGETGKLYIAKDTGIVYRWGGTTYVAVSEADIATTSKAGIVKPDGSTVTIDVDGTLHAQGGHKILDSEGTQLAQKTKLQFLNSQVQNVGDKTVVTPKGKADYEFETYQDMMDAIEDEEVEPDSTIYVMEGEGSSIPGAGGAGTKYGTCTTAAAERNKVATLTDDNWDLEVGCVIGIRFTYNNSYSATAAAPVTLNVNDKGAKEIRGGNVSAAVTGTNTTYFGRANALNYYMYDGTYWIWAGSTYDNNTTAMQSLGNGYGTCTTAAATADKVVTLSGYNLMINGFVSVRFTNDVPANATMNINNRGAKNIFYKNARITAGVIKAGDLVTFVYDGTQYRVISIQSPVHAEEVEWSVWNAMTEAERDAYSAGKKIDIKNVPGADGTISADLMTLIWTNPNPNTAFAAQTISVDLSEYDYVFVDYRWSSTAVAHYQTSIVLINGLNTRLTYVSGSGSTTQGTYAAWRDITLNSDSMVFGSAMLIYTGIAATTKNIYIVPIQVYGIKKTISLKINAIASDVSTSASKCMMSDGETSVEDEITSINSDLTDIIISTATVNVIVCAHADYTNVNNYKPSTPSGYTWFLAGALPSVATTSVIGIEGALEGTIGVNRIMCKNDSGSQASVSMTLSWIGIKKI